MLRPMSKRNPDLLAQVMPFVTTVEERSLTRAAQVLRVTPSAISRASTRLESDLGARLLNRTPRAVTLTHEGSLFYRECQNAVAGMRKARHAVSQAQTSPTGTMRVSLPLALGERVVMPALPRLLAAHPGLSIEAILTDRYVDLAAEDFDAVLRIGRQRNSDLRIHRLPPVRWSTVASPAYLARQGVPHRPEDLRRHICLRFILPTGAPQPWLFKARGGKVARFALQGNLASDNPHGLLEAALAGFGMIQAHSYLVAIAIAEGRLIEVLKEFAAPPLPLAILFPPGRERSPKTRAFIEAVTQLLSALP